MAGRHSAGKRSASPDSPAAEKAPKKALSGRKALYLRIGVTVLALAAVIFGVSLFNTGKKSDNNLPPITGSPTSTVGATGTPTTPSGTSTQTGSTGTSSTTNSGTNTGTNTGATTTSTVLMAGVYGSKIANLGSVVPATFAGYDMRTVDASGDAYIIPLAPDATGPKDTVSVAVVSITDKNSASKAAEFVDGIDKAYSHNVMHATAGSAKGIFATDGQRIAAFRFARGRYVVEVLVTSANGTPSELKSEVLRLAALMPASQP